MNRGTTPWIFTVSEVLSPTHTASSQWVFSSPRLTRLNLVRPPVPPSIGSPKACNRSYKAHLIVFTAVASLSGAWAWATIRFRMSGFSARKTLISNVPFFDCTSHMQCRGWKSCPSHLSLDTGYVRFAAGGSLHYNTHISSSTS